jgi:hypothetical protein
MGLRISNKFVTAKIFQIIITNLFFPKICEKLQIPQSQQLIESCNSAEVKSLLKERTEEAMATGAFGLPWIVLKREGQKVSSEMRKSYN